MKKTGKKVDQKPAAKKGKPRRKKPVRAAKAGISAEPGKRNRHSRNLP